VAKISEMEHDWNWSRNCDCRYKVVRYTFHNLTSKDAIQGSLNLLNIPTVVREVVNCSLVFYLSSGSAEES